MDLDVIREALSTTKLIPHGSTGGGSINTGQGFVTDTGPVYIKLNNLPNSKAMFDGEFESLAKIYATNTVRVPRPIKVIATSTGTGAMLAIEYFDMKRGLRRYESELGCKLGQLHAFNGDMLERKARQDTFVGQQKDGFVVEPITKFGFHVDTNASPDLATFNTWCDDWLQFYTRQKLMPLIEQLNANRMCKELNELWSDLITKIPALFADCQPISPCLLHGDMWNGNVAELDTEPVLFDPMSFYGHSEFEFGIAEMFGGFSPAFYDAYHKIMPKTKGFAKRNKIYQLFHHLNHWCIFGDSYKSSTLSLMRRLCK